MFRAGAFPAESENGHSQFSGVQKSSETEGKLTLSTPGQDLALFYGTASIRLWAL
jgi:hypothetical protein